MLNKFPINASPVIAGAKGKAWLVDLAATYTVNRMPDCDRNAVCFWVVEAPLAHPLWHSYSILLVHLREKPGREVEIYLAGATHELHVYACDPRADLNKMLMGRITGAWLLPPNFMTQIIAASDEEADQRVREAVRKICDGELSPEHREAWVAAYGDNMIRPEHRRLTENQPAQTYH